MLYCVNKFFKTYKCPAYAKALPNGHLEFITNHNSSCMMERLRRQRGIVKKRRKKVRPRPKKNSFPVRNPTKKFDKTDLSEYFGASLQEEPSNVSVQEEGENLTLIDEANSTQEKKNEPIPESGNVKTEVSDLLNRIKDRIKKKAFRKVKKFMLKN